MDFKEQLTQIRSDFLMAAHALISDRIKHDQVSHRGVQRKTFYDTLMFSFAAGLWRREDLYRWAEEQFGIKPSCTRKWVGSGTHKMQFPKDQERVIGAMNAVLNKIEDTLGDMPTQSSDMDKYTEELGRDLEMLRQKFITDFMHVQKKRLRSSNIDLDSNQDVVSGDVFTTAIRFLVANNIVSKRQIAEHANTGYTTVAGWLDRGKVPCRAARNQKFQQVLECCEM